MALAVSEAVQDGVPVWLHVTVELFTGVSLGLSLGVTDTVADDGGVTVGVKVAEFVQVSVAVQVTVSVAEGVPVPLTLGVDVSVAVQVLVRVAVGDTVSVFVPVGDRLNVEVGDSVTVLVSVGGTVNVEVGGTVKVFPAVGVDVGDGMAVALAVQVGVPDGVDVDVSVRLRLRLCAILVSNAASMAVGLPWTPTDPVLSGVSVGLAVKLGVSLGVGPAPAEDAPRRREDRIVRKKRCLSMPSFSALIGKIPHALCATLSPGGLLQRLNSACAGAVKNGALSNVNGENRGFIPAGKTLGSTPSGRRPCRLNGFDAGPVIRMALSAFFNFQPQADPTAPSVRPDPKDPAVPAPS